MKINEEKLYKLFANISSNRKQSRKLKSGRPPEGCILYGVAEDGPADVWIPSDTPNRMRWIICISKETGKILYDRNVGE